MFRYFKLMKAMKFIIILLFIISTSNCFTFKKIYRNTVFSTKNIKVFLQKSIKEEE